MYDIVLHSCLVMGERRPPTSLCPYIFSYKFRYIVGFGLVEMAISTNPRSAIYVTCTRKPPTYIVIWRWDAATELTGSVIVPSFRDQCHILPRWLRFSGGKTGRNQDHLTAGPPDPLPLSTHRWRQEEAQFNNCLNWPVHRLWTDSRHLFSLSLSP